jgi:hypothetical protein
MAMSGASGVGAPGISPGAQYAMKTIKMQVDMVREMGDHAVDLIRSASILDPAVGNKLDLSA